CFSWRGLPPHQPDVADLEAIVATFTAVFPHVQLWVAYHRSLTPLAALVGAAQPLSADAAAVRPRGGAEARPPPAAPRGGEPRAPRAHSHGGGRGGAAPPGPPPRLDPAPAPIAGAP